MKLINCFIFWGVSRLKRQPKTEPEPKKGGSSATLLNTLSNYEQFPYFVWIQTDGMYCSGLTLSLHEIQNLPQNLPYKQCNGSKYIEFGYGSWTLAQYRSGCGSRSGSGSRVMLSISKEKTKFNFREQQFFVS